MTAAEKVAVVKGDSGSTVIDERADHHVPCPSANPCDAMNKTGQSLMSFRTGGGDGCNIMWLSFYVDLRFRLSGDRFC
jgi:hypothetical protein